MLGIIGAMEIEVAALKEKMGQPTVNNIAGMNFYKGDIGDKEVVVVKSGIGKVNAAICAQVLVDYYRVDGLINTGVAGSLNNDINICDIVISTETQEHDMDVSPLGYEAGIIPDMETSIYKADKKLMEIAKNSAKNIQLNVAIFEGKVLSGDQFIGTAEKKEYLKKTFWGDCAEMEGAAIGHVAYCNHVPYLVVRAISDKADGGAQMDYPSFEKIAADNSIKLMEEIIKEY